MPIEQEDCKALLEWMFPFVEQLLSKYGEFYPVGGALDISGAQTFVAIDERDEHPDSINVILDIKNLFIEAASSGKYNATALFYSKRCFGPTFQIDV